jgi:hypothetical protein
VRNWDFIGAPILHVVIAEVNALFLIFEKRRTRMQKKITAISLIVVMVLSLTACAKEPSAQEIVDNVIESFDNISTYQFDTDMAIDIAGEVDGVAIEYTAMMDNSGTLDLENIQMGADLVANFDQIAPEEGESELGLKVYIADGMVYMYHYHMPESPE